MTDLLTPTGTQRLLGEAPQIPVPHLSTAQLVALAEASGLTGRGGAGFPTARKLASITGPGGSVTIEVSGAPEAGAAIVAELAKRDVLVVFRPGAGIRLSAA